MMKIVTGSVEETFLFSDISRFLRVQIIFISPTSGNRNTVKFDLCQQRRKCMRM